MGLELFGPETRTPTRPLRRRGCQRVSTASSSCVPLFREHGIQVAGGQGEMAGRIFRIGHCGYFDAFAIIATIAAT